MSVSPESQHGLSVLYSALTAFVVPQLRTGLVGSRAAG